MATLASVDFYQTVESIRKGVSIIGDQAKEENEEFEDQNIKKFRPIENNAYGDSDD
jgi:hypothetical protein